MIYKGKRPRGMTAVQLSALALVVLVALFALTVHVSSAYTGEFPGRVVAEAFLVEPTHSRRKIRRTRRLWRRCCLRPM